MGQTVAGQVHGVGSGRSGNHNDDAWALVLPAGGVGPHEAECDLGDIAATALSRFGLASAYAPGSKYTVYWALVVAGP